MFPPEKIARRICPRHQVVVVDLERGLATRTPPRSSQKPLVAPASATALRASAVQA